MIKYKNLTILGTSHIAKQSIKEVEGAITKGKPDIVALELDNRRLAALLDKKRPKPRLGDIKRIGVKGWLFSLIGAWAEKKLGEKVGVSPGSEMKRAFELAKKNRINVAMIDQDIEITLRKVSKSLTWKEKWNFIADAFKTIVLKKKEVVFDLSKVPSERVIKRLTSKVKKRYPNLYHVLVEERNSIMAANIAKIVSRYPEKNILAIIGAGHEKEIIGLIKEMLKQPAISYSFTVG